MRDDTSIREQVSVCQAWKRYMGIWYSLHYVLGIVAVGLSVTVASKPFTAEQGSNLYSLLAWVLAMATGFIAFLHPEQRGDRYQRAWSILAAEITRYRADQTYTINHVLDAYARGENIIHQTAAHEQVGRHSKIPTAGR